MATMSLHASPTGRCLILILTRLFEPRFTSLGDSFEDNIVNRRPMTSFTMENRDFDGWYAELAGTLRNEVYLEAGVFLRHAVDTIPLRTMRTVKRRRCEIPSTATFNVKQTK